MTPKTNCRNKFCLNSEPTTDSIRQKHYETVMSKDGLENDMAAKSANIDISNEKAELVSKDAQLEGDLKIKEMGRGRRRKVTNSMMKDFIR